MEAYFNELSLEPPVGHVTHARGVMTSLVRTVAAGTRRGAISGLRTDAALLSRPVCEAYTVADWLNDGVVDREEKRLLSSAASKMPFVDDIVADIHQGGLVECRCQTRLALGCAAALVVNGPLVSLERAVWSLDPLQVELLSITDQTEQSTTQEVCNLWSPACYDRRAGWFAEALARRLENGRDVLREEGGSLRHLAFCQTARDQLMAMSGSGTEFPHVVRHLVALNQRAATWTDGVFAALYPYPCSPESESTLQRYGRERRFMCPDGQARTFSWHSKVNVGAWRVYFYPIAPRERVLIGYIGPHLAIVSG